ASEGCWIEGEGDHQPAQDEGHLLPDPEQRRRGAGPGRRIAELQLGYAAAWTGSSAPLFWIWQKMTFILGGLMIPLTLYPAPYGSLAAVSPFAAMVFAPASFLLDASPRAILATLALQLFWLAVIGTATLLVARAAAARFAAHGI
ncbi:MAG TPA: hypothetical protein VGH25_07855, partial [Dongiaceae bacterium]